MPLAILNLGPWEIALIVFLALLLFGGKKLPTLAKDLGTGIKEFRKSLFSNAEEEDIHTNQQVNYQTEEKKNTKPPRSKKKKV
ncbi:MAG: twin-arginine translocase TatA/TatE family subunit [Leptospiraceae bacterium]|nr:twin-arginine translocase TatA/TatE family subunit [Leptospiraceae bacterium]